MLCMSFLFLYVLLFHSFSWVRSFILSVSTFFSFQINLPQHSNLLIISSFPFRPVFCVSTIGFSAEDWTTIRHWCHCTTFKMTDHRSHLGSIHPEAWFSVWCASGAPLCILPKPVAASILDGAYSSDEERAV